MIDPKTVAETREEYIKVLEQSLRDLRNEIAVLRTQAHYDAREEKEGWCGHCSCQACCDASRKADHW